MHNAIAALARLQPVSREISGPRLSARFRSRRLTRPFIPLPLDYLETIPRLYRAAFMALWEYGHGQPCSMPHRLLAAKLEASTATAQRHVYALRDGGWLGVLERKRSRCRNHPNLYTFPGLAGFITSDEEKQGQKDTSTKAPGERPAESLPVRPSYTREVWEHRKAADHPPALGRLHAVNERVMAENRSLREIVRGRDHQARRPDASVGMWRPDMPDGYYSGEAR